MDYKILNLKQDAPSIEQALAIFQINLNVAKLEGVKVMKIIHGYGSHGVGGGICLELRKMLRSMKRSKEIKDYMLGNEWDIARPKCLKLLGNLNDCYDDEDLGKMNPGITIVVL